MYGSTLGQRLGGQSHVHRIYGVQACTASSILHSKAGLLAATQESGIILERSQVTPAGPLRDG